MSHRMQTKPWVALPLILTVPLWVVGCSGEDPDEDDVSPTPTVAPTATPTATPCTDADSDQSCLADDCNDADPFIFPNAVEVPYNTVDEDCNGTDLIDVDGDGFTGDATGTDCNDTSAAIYPGAVDACSNSIDENCDGVADNQPECPNQDYDGDGYSEDGSVGGLPDCNDLDPLESPGAPEYFDGKDNNCDGQIERSAMLSRTANLVIEGSTSSERVGFSVAGCYTEGEEGFLPASVNGDTFADVLIGATGHGGLDRGGMAVYFGGASWTYSTSFSSAPFVYSETQSAAKAGTAVGCAGDINYDGYLDFGVSSSEYDTSGSARESGRVYVFLGQIDNWASATLDNGAAATIPGYFSQVYMGTGISGGNVNGDSFDDLLVGAAATEDGWAFILPGGAAIPPSVQVQNLSKVQATEGRLLGQSIAFAGDSDGDGFGDFLATGAYSADRAGYVLWMPGSSYYSPNSWYGVDVTGFGISPLEKYIELIGTVAQENVGWSSSGNGDVNGDGHPDYMVGDEKTVDRTDPVAFLFYGGPNYLGGSIPAQAQMNLNDKANVKFFAGTGDNCPCSVALDGDMNGDGYSDVLVGVSGRLASDGSGTKAGRVYVVLGRPSWPSTLTLDLDADYILDAATPDEQAGRSVAWAGDINGDGLGDFLIGAPYADIPTESSRVQDAGRAYVLLGRLVPTP